MTPDQRRHHNDVHASLVNEILNELGKRADCVVWRAQHPGTYLDPRTRNPIKIGPDGIGDIDGAASGGKRISIEVKTGNAEPSPAQKRFHAALRSVGVETCIARSVPDAVAYVDRLTK